MDLPVQDRNHENVKNHIKLLKEVFSGPLNIYTQFPWDIILKAKRTFAKLEENKTEQLPSTSRRFQPNPLGFGMGSKLGKKKSTSPSLLEISQENQFQLSKNLQPKYVWLHI